MPSRKEDYERNTYQTSTGRSKSATLYKSMTTALGFQKPLFPKVRKDEEEETDVIETEESEEDESSSPQWHKLIDEEDLKDMSRRALAERLTKCGYSAAILEDPAFLTKFAKGVGANGEIVSRKSGVVCIDRTIPEEPPVEVTKNMSIGEDIQLFNWVPPTSVSVDEKRLFPRGKITKLYVRHCLVSKEPYPLDRMPRPGMEFVEAERLEAVELDGRGPYPIKEGDDSVPVPFVVKDGTVIMRFPPLAPPSGQTRHVDPGIM